MLLLSKIDSESASCKSSYISQASFSMEGDLPTQWSSDLREGLSMMGISYCDLKNEQLPLIYSLFNVLSYPLSLFYYRFLILKQSANVFLCDDSFLPLTMSIASLKDELNKRSVYYKETDDRDSLVHLLEMDILYRSQRIFLWLPLCEGVKGKYVDYNIKRITAFDVFHEKYGEYTGPMLSELLKEKGVHPPRFLYCHCVIHRRIVDRVKIVVDSIDKVLQTKFKVCYFITC